MKCIKTTIGMMVLLFTSGLWAQKQTEIYIPVGQSPGVSGKYSAIGEIVAVNAQDSTVIIAREGHNKTIKINADCIIYLDKSPLKQTNKIGSWADIKQGLGAEVKYNGNEQGSGAE